MVKNRIQFAITLILLLTSTISIAKNISLLKTMPESANYMRGYGTIKVGAERTDAYFGLLDSTARVAVVANKTSMIGKTHLVDSLLGAGKNVVKIFALEHGFRGDAANGEHVKDEKDSKTGLPIISLYGNNKQPTTEQMQDIDFVIFDLQDVGVRFYTYLTSMHYIMQACATNKKTLIVLDRPNPNGFYTDGPTLKKGYESMVGIHPIPLVHGMTLGELAFMINGEKWLNNGDTCALIVVKCENYLKSMKFSLPISPSPNLPSFESILLYPSLGLFEGTEVSMGRGTNKPFECFGTPWLKSGTLFFTPVNIPGKATNPPYMNVKCRGYDLHQFANTYLSLHNKIYLEWLILLYSETPNKSTFFNANFFDKLAGSSELRTQIQAGKSSDEIRKSWKDDLDLFISKRTPYLIY